MGLKAVGRAIIALSILFIGVTCEHSATVKQDKLPEPLNLVRPSYPEEAKKSNIEGIVIARVLVNETGKVDSVELVKSSGSALLDNAAQEAALKSTFKPATRNGQPVASWVVIPFQFILSTKEAPK